MLDKHIENFKNGDKKSFEEIYLLTEKLVYSICLSYMKDKSLAEDMMQDTYINVIKYIDKYKIGTNPTSWIIKIAKNNCLNEIKRRKRIEIVEDTDVDLVSTDVRKKETPLLDIALKILKEKELVVLLPHIIDGKKLIDISKDLNISEGTIRWRYNNALTKIRKYVERSNEND